MHSIIFITSTLSGGVGRVINILTEGFSKKGLNVNVIKIEGTEEKGYKFFRLFYLFLAMISSRLLKNSEKASIFKYKSRNYRKISVLKAQLKKEKNATVIAFLNEPIFLSLLSVQKGQKLIISERNDPSQFVENKTTMAFIKTLYQNSDLMVCQSPDAKKWYDENTSVKSTVIFNPIKADLPERFSGSRQKKIVNFCRISTQKNLLLLVDSFAKLEKVHPDYELYIFGDAVGNGAEGYVDQVKKKVDEYTLNEKVHIENGRSDIHTHILDYSMFVSSSDFEGMSNSMLEAMAIGLPTICTDCPAGGARAVINDHENGILTPLGDADALYLAMKEVIENPELAEKLSKNGTKLRESQSVEKIVEQWLEIIND